MAGSREDVMSVASVSDPRLATEVGTRTRGSKRMCGAPGAKSCCDSAHFQDILTPPMIEAPVPQKEAT
jgi:hypothetical protein